MRTFKSALSIGLATFTISTFSFTALAQIQPSTASNSKKCIQYFEINGKSYCSNQAIAPSPSMKEAVDKEHNSFTFDGRKWKLGWWNEDAQKPMLEYSLASETPNTWTELVTSQFFPGLQNKITPEQFMKLMLGETLKRGFQAKAKVYAQNPHSILYEWRVDNHPVENQDELIRIMSNSQGLYVLHYASRPTMSDDRRKAWLTILAKAHPKL